MLHLKGMRHCLETIMLLSRTSPQDDLQSVATLTDAYRRFIERVQPQVPVPSEPGVCMPTDPEDVARLVALFNVKSDLDDSQYGDIRTVDDAAAAKSILSDVRSYKDALAGDHSEFGTLFDMAVHTVFTSPSPVAAGGTASALLGVIWVDPRRGWAACDYQEFLVHELAHTLLFLDEWRYEIFPSQEAMIAKENYALSAVRCTMRPLDKALHSVIVAADVLLLRERVTGHPERPLVHPKTPELIEGILRSCESILGLERRDDVLAPYGFELVELCREEATRVSADLGLGAYAEAGV